MNRRPWTDAERAEVARRYPNECTEAIARDLGRSVESVYYVAQKAGLKKTLQFMREVHGATLKRPAGQSSRFKPGHTTWNKGKPGSTGLHPNTRRTQFKPGRAPEEARNYRPIGSERITKDGYLERKVSDDTTAVPARRWIAVHRLVWEAANGPIPPGHIVVFRRGMATTNRDEITLDRLELITRSENMQRNTRHNLPEEINSIITARARLVRAINKRLRHEEQN